MKITEKAQAAGLIFMLALCFGGCRKVKYENDPLAYYPKVRTESVQVEPDGSVTVTGEILSPGSGDLYFAGFCLDSVANPEMHINQQLVKELTGNRFTTVYKNLDDQKSYHVRSFAVNEFGFTYGEDMLIERAGMDTSIIPCHPGKNKLLVTYGGMKRAEDMSYLASLDEYNRVTVSSYPSSLGLRLEFAKRPTTGKYEIWHNPSRGSNAVEAVFLDPSNGSSEMDNGGELYVQRLEGNRIRVWVCEQRCGSRTITACFTTL